MNTVLRLHRARPVRTRFSQLLDRFDQTLNDLEESLPDYIAAVLRDLIREQLERMQSDPAFRREVIGELRAALFPRRQYCGRSHLPHCTFQPAG